MMGNAQEHTKKCTEQRKESQKVHTKTEKEERLLTFTGKQNHCILFQNPQGFLL